MSFKEVNVNVGGPKKDAPYTYKEVILKPNKSFAEQVATTDRIYVIKWDFDLGGEEVTVPANCVLKFEGGSLSNGALIGQNTNIEGEASIFCDIRGNWNSDFNLKWFGAVCDNTTDNTSIIKRRFEQMNDYRGVFVLPSNCKFNEAEVFASIPKGCVMNIPLKKGLSKGGWKSSYVGFAAKDDPNDDKSFFILSGHFPAFDLVNTGTCTYGEESSDSQKSGLLRKCVIGFCTDYNVREDETIEGQGPKQTFVMLGTFTSLSDNKEYEVQFRPYYCFSKDKKIDFSAFSIAATGIVSVNGEEYIGRDLNIHPSKLGTKEYASLRIDNNESVGDIDRKSLIEFRARENGGSLRLATIIFNPNNPLLSITNDKNNISLYNEGNKNIIDIIIDRVNNKLLHLENDNETDVSKFEVKNITFNNIGGFSSIPLDNQLSGNTPLISNSQIYYIANSQATNMSDILIPSNISTFYSYIILVFKDSNTNVKGNGKIRLRDNQDWKPNMNSLLILKKDTRTSNNWIEILRYDSNIKYGDNRPTNIQIGFQFFDTTLGKPIWWNGIAWVDATGAAV